VVGNNYSERNRVRGGEKAVIVAGRKDVFVGRALVFVIRDRD
jgi:hypothetical protein